MRAGRAISAAFQKTDVLKLPPRSRIEERLILSLEETGGTPRSEQESLVEIERHKAA
jgi:hypothetical protein